MNWPIPALEAGSTAGRGSLGQAGWVLPVEVEADVGGAEQLSGHRARRPRRDACGHHGGRRGSGARQAARARPSPRRRGGQRSGRRGETSRLRADEECGPAGHTTSRARCRSTQSTARTLDRRCGGVRPVSPTRGRQALRWAMSTRTSSSRPGRSPRTSCCPPGWAAPAPPTGRVLHAVDHVSLTVAARGDLAWSGRRQRQDDLGRLVLRLYKPTSATCSNRGRSVLGLSRAEDQRLRKSVQTIFQDPYSSLTRR